MYLLYQSTAIPGSDIPVIYTRELALTLALALWLNPVRCRSSRCRPVPAEADRRSRCLTRETPEEQERGERERPRESVLCTISPVFVYQLSTVTRLFLLPFSPAPSVCLLCPNHPIPSIHPPLLSLFTSAIRPGNTQISADASAPRPISRATPPREALRAPALSSPARLSQSPSFSPLILLFFFVLLFFFFFLYLPLVFSPQVSTDRCCCVWG